MNGAVKIEGKNIILTLPLETANASNKSKSGKTHVIAGTGGFVRTGVIDPTSKKEISVGANFTIPAD